MSICPMVSRMLACPLKNQSGMRGIFSSSSFRSRPVERMVISTPPFPSVFISTFLFSSCPALNKRVIPSFVTTRRYSAGGGVAPSNLNASVLIFLLVSLLLKVFRIAASGATPCNTAPRNSSGFQSQNLPALTWLLVQTALEL